MLPAQLCEQLDAAASAARSALQSQEATHDTTMDSVLDEAMLAAAPTTRAWSHPVLELSVVGPALRQRLQKLQVSMSDLMHADPYMPQADIPSFGADILAGAAVSAWLSEAEHLGIAAHAVPPSASPTPHAQVLARNVWLQHGLWTVVWALLAMPSSIPLSPAALATALQLSESDACPAALLAHTATRVDLDSASLAAQGLLATVDVASVDEDNHCSAQTRAALAKAGHTHIQALSHAALTLFTMAPLAEESSATVWQAAAEKLSRESLARVLLRWSAAQLGRTGLRPASVLLSAEQELKLPASTPAHAWGSAFGVPVPGKQYTTREYIAARAACSNEWSTLFAFHGATLRKLQALERAAMPSTGRGLSSAGRAALHSCVPAGLPETYPSFRQWASQAAQALGSVGAACPFACPLGLGLQQAALCEEGTMLTLANVHWGRQITATSTAAALQQRNTALLRSWQVLCKGMQCCVQHAVVGALRVRAWAQWMEEAQRAGIADGAIGTVQPGDEPGTLQVLPPAEDMDACVAWVKQGVAQAQALPVAMQLPEPAWEAGLQWSSPGDFVVGVPASAGTIVVNVTVEQPGMLVLPCQARAQPGSKELAEYMWAWSDPLVTPAHGAPVVLGQCTYVSDVGQVLWASSAEHAAPSEPAQVTGARAVLLPFVGIRPGLASVQLYRHALGEPLPRSPTLVVQLGVHTAQPSAALQALQAATHAEPGPAAHAAWSSMPIQALQEHAYFATEMEEEEVRAQWRAEFAPVQQGSIL